MSMNEITIRLTDNEYRQYVKKGPARVSNAHEMVLY